jgi:hypothetical protein
VGAGPRRPAASSPPPSPLVGGYVLRQHWVVGFSAYGFERERQAGLANSAIALRSEKDDPANRCAIPRLLSQRFGMRLRAYDFALAFREDSFPMAVLVILTNEQSLIFSFVRFVISLTLLHSGSWIPGRRCVNTRRLPLEQCEGVAGSGGASCELAGSPTVSANLRVLAERLLLPNGDGSFIPIDLPEHPSSGRGGNGMVKGVAARRL